MLIYILFTILILFCGALSYCFCNKSKCKFELCKDKNDSEIQADYYPVLNDRKSRNLFIFCGIVLFFIFMLRNENVGTDIKTYRVMFDNFSQVSFLEILFQNESLTLYGPNQEIGYAIFTKIFSLFDSFRLYVLVIAAFEVFALFYVIGRRSVMPFLSILIYFTFEFFNFQLSALRQGIALSCVLLAINMIIDKKNFKAFLWIILALSFHKSAIFALPMLFLNVRIFDKPPVRILAMLLFAVVFLLRKPIIQIIANFVYGGYQIEETGAFAMLLFILFLTVFLMFYSYRYLKNRKSFSLYLNIIFICSMIMIGNTVSMVVIRVAYYYEMILILLIPMLISGMKSKSLRKVATLVFIVFFISFAFILNNISSLNAVPYGFFF